MQPLQVINRAEADRIVLEFARVSAGFTALLNHYGAPAAALRRFGLNLWQEQNLEGAAQVFSVAAVLTPDDADLWRDLAFVYDASGKVEAALACINRSIELHAAHARSFLLQGGLHSRLNEQTAAENAYRKAIALDPTLGDAHFGLGLLCYEARRFIDAAANLGEAIEHGYANALGFSCLAYAFYAIGDFAGCAAMFEAASDFGPLDSKAQKKFARARTFEAMIEGGADDALARYPDLAGADAEDINDIASDAFSLLSAFGHKDAAIDIGQRRLAQNPDDPVQLYLLQAVSGAALDRAPLAYLERYFDNFAPEFDAKLVGILNYRVPELLAALVAQHENRFTHVLDLGCGTGLSAAALADFGGTLTGVDLSAGMLAQATKRGIYTNLVKHEAVAYLQAHPQQFDLVLSADVLIYFGDLKPVVAAVAEALSPSGLFAFSIEATTDADYAILPSGRFAHSIHAVSRLMAGSFAVLDVVPHVIRLEANAPIDGVLVVARKL